jgi:hypothetical protein
MKAAILWTGGNVGPVGREKVEAELGKPLQEAQTDFEPVAAYQYAGSEEPTCKLRFGRSNQSEDIALYLPFDSYCRKMGRADPDYLVIAYSSDDTVLRYRVTLNKSAALEWVSLLPVCDISVARATKLDPDAQANLYHQCFTALVVPSPSYLMWKCLGAHHHHSYAQERLAVLYDTGLYGVPEDPVRAYLWYSLSKRGSAMEKREKLVAEMTSDQIAEAKHLVQNWKSNPAECETFVEQIEN